MLWLVPKNYQLIKCLGEFVGNQNATPDSKDIALCYAMVFSQIINNQTRN